MTIADFNTIIRLFSKQFNASISSAHRTAKHNMVVGGVSDSQHLGWKCVDIVLDEWVRKNEAMVWLTKAGLYVFDEVTSKNHLHVDDRNNVDI
jgi:hypothetical protein